MVDYQKLYIKLYNEITKTLDILEKVQKETFEEFIDSKPTKDEVEALTSGIDFKSNTPFKIE